MSKIMTKYGAEWLVDDAWEPLEPAMVPAEPDSALVDALAQEKNITRDEAAFLIMAYEANCTYWINSRYQVQLRLIPNQQAAHLNIRSRDGKVIMRDWRHFQWIKNQLVGPECEAVELYPAESRCVDANNKYHLWCSLDPSFRFPFGMVERDVNYTDEGNTNGTRQRTLL